MRERVIELVRDAADPETDGKWLSNSADFDEWFNTLDDLLPEGALASIGVSLADESEAEAVGKLLKARDAIFMDLGDVDYRTYRDDPRWLEVLQAARAALALLDLDAK